MKFLLGPAKGVCDTVGKNNWGAQGQAGISKILNSQS